MQSFRIMAVVLGLFVFSIIWAPPEASAQTSNAASFLRSDTTTQGNWHGAYGADGYSVADDSQNLPSYSTFALQNQQDYTWVPNTADPRALQTGSGSGRIAATWYNSSSFSLDVNFTDGNTHQLALYAVDWDSQGRSETVQILDATTAAVLDTRSISSFTGGAYLVWNISGHVTISVTQNSGPNAVISGVFFGGSSTITSSASFLRSDATTQGNWHGAYGADGYSVANDSQSLPSYGSFAVAGEENYTWDADPADPRALQTGSGSGRIAATWYNTATFSFDVNFTDGNTHQVALYAVDWDSQGRSETIQVQDAATEALLDTRVVSAFTNGAYLVWNISGHVTISVIGTAGPNAVISGVFFGGSTTISSTAVFVNSDAATQGNWQGTYGADGYSVASSTQSLPAYASFAPQNQANWTWDANPTDPRALETGIGSARIAATWYNNPSFNFDVNFTDGNAHQLSLYAVDYDSQGRAESVQILDAATEALLDTETLPAFTSGVYLAWNISGHVKINVIGTSGPNAVISGAFFDPVKSSSSTPTLVSIAVTPANSSVPFGNTQQFAATGTYSDGSTQDLTSTATWTSSMAAVATINSAGLATSVAQGTTTITASFGGFTSSTTLGVTPGVPVAINVSPQNSSFAVGAAEQFIATGIYSDGSTQNLTASVAWSSSDTSVVTISNTAPTQGLAAGVSLGTATISAALAGVTGTTTISVLLPPTIASLSPTLGPVGTDVTINGMNLGTGNGNYSVTFGGVNASISTWNSISILAQAPVVPSPGPTPVVVTTPGGVSNSLSFNVLPEITRLSPPSGPLGASVTINGLSFGTSGSVTFNGVPATISSWNPLYIVAIVPSTATTGNIVVTSNSIASSGVLFTIEPPAGASSLSVSSGVFGTPVTITGSGFGASQSSEGGEVEIGGALSPVTDWEDTSITATVPADASPGLGSVTVTLGGVASNPLPFTVIPSLSAGSSSCPNPDETDAPGSPFQINGYDLGSGQGSSTLSFGGQLLSVSSWTPGGLLVRIPGSQPAGPVAVSATVAGMATSTVEYMVCPGISTVSPAAGQIGSTVTISGGGFGDSGSISFNGLPASIQDWTDTAVTTQVPSGATSGPLMITTSSGLQTNTANFTVLPALGAPISITIQPASATLVVGDTRNLLAVDSNGNTVSSASWTVDNTSLASISTDVPPMLTTLAPGSITLTATYQGLTAQATWTISGSALAVGTPLWTLPADGFGVTSIVPGGSIIGGADMFSIESTSSYPNSYLVRGITLDGSPTWTTQVPPLAFDSSTSGVYGASAYGNPMVDPLGNLLLETQNGPIMVDGVTAQQDWSYTGYPANGWASLLAVHPNGTALYLVSGSPLVVEQLVNPITSVTALNTLTGQQEFTVDVPPSFFDIEILPEGIDSQLRDYTGPSGSPTGPMSVMPDGTAVFEAAPETYNYVTDCGGLDGFGPYSGTININSQLMLITVQPDGSFANQLLDSFAFNGSGPLYTCSPTIGSTPAYLPGQIIPDGQGGLLASRTKIGLFGEAHSNITHIGRGSTPTFPIPCNLLVSADSESGNAYMLLGDDGTIFTTCNNLGSSGAPVLYALDENSGSIKWAYTGTVGSVLTLIAASDGGGVAAKSTYFPQGNDIGVDGVDTILRFDASGNLATDTWTASGIINFGGGFWLGTSSSSSSPPSAYNAPEIPLSASGWYSPEGNGGKAATPDITISDYSQSAPNQTVITDVVQEVLDAVQSSTFIESAACPKCCSKWVESGTVGASDIGTIESIPTWFGHGTIKTQGFTDYQTFAITNLSSTNEDKSPTNWPTNLVTLVNDVSGFYNGSYIAYNPAYLTGQKTYPLLVGTQGYTGGTLRAQAAILLHEFGHSLLIPNFEQNDFGSTEKEEFNDSLVNTNCRRMIEALPSITSVSPPSGPVGTQVTITGTNLGSSQGTSTVTFNGQSATPTSWTANKQGITTIIVPAPSNGIGNIIVTILGVRAFGPPFTVQ